MSFDEDNRLPSREWEPMTAAQLAFLYSWTVFFILWVGSQYLKWKNSPSFSKFGAATAKEDTQNLPLPNTLGGQLLSFSHVGQKRHTIVKWSVIFGLCVGYLYLCDRTPLVDRGTKTYSRDIYLFLNGVYILWSLLDVRKTHTSSPLNRDQTEEWKGWMQFAFLAYHYFNAREAYNAIRLFVGCYVWMTGFGNFSYFYTKNDFSLVRMLNMLWRLNLLVVAMCIVMNRPYMLYYIVPLHTTWFFFVYTFMRIKRHVNYTELGLKFKFLCGGTLIFLVWEFPAIFNTVFAPFTWMLGIDGNLHEWYFRSFLDHFVPIWGMLFAFNYPAYEKALVYLERKCSYTVEWIVKGTVSAILAFLAYYWFNQYYLMEKFTYNRYHPYTEIIPIVVFIWFRNVTEGLRSYYSHTMSRLGQITLETYLCQFHIFLADDAAHLVVLVPHYPFLNCLLVTAIYVIVAKLTFHSTVNLRAAVIPAPKDCTNTSLLKAIAKSLAFLLCLWIGCYAFMIMIPSGIFWHVFVAVALAGSYASLQYMQMTHSKPHN